MAGRTPAKSRARQRAGSPAPDTAPDVSGAGVPATSGAVTVRSVGKTQRYRAARLCPAGHDWHGVDIPDECDGYRFSPKA